jgi:thiol-disulfide isomerase/thioredoxin
MTLFQRVHMPSLDRAVGWLNSEPLGPADLRGRVVLVNFWTFTCINWLRTLPYVRAWAEKYEADGLVVVGVHTPEFPFEADAENVARMVQKLRVDYPVAIDSRYGIWDEFANSYWPALYLADREGALCFEHFGEGATKSPSGRSKTSFSPATGISSPWKGQGWRRRPTGSSSILQRRISAMAAGRGFRPPVAEDQTSGGSTRCPRRCG